MFTLRINFYLPEANIFWSVLVRQNVLVHFWGLCVKRINNLILVHLYPSVIVEIRLPNDFPLIN